MNSTAAGGQKDLLCISATAPGKVILAGEYAVLFGWPAIVFAVDRMFSVTFEQTQYGKKGLQVALVGLALDPRVLPIDEAGNALCPSDSPLRMFADIFNALTDYYELKPLFIESSWKLKLDSSALFDCGDKLGLGSSAALTVALDKAMRQILRSDIERSRLSQADGIDANSESAAAQTEQHWARLHRLHSQVQGKQGSGVDIAASLNGACSVFVNESHRRCKLLPVELPNELSIRFIWSGQSASTPAYLQSLSHWKFEHPERFDEHMNALGLASSELARVCEAGRISAEKVIHLMHTFTVALFEFDSASQLGIFSENHAFMFEKSKAFESLIYKPCGAGGGDIGIAAGFDRAELDAFCTDIESRGMRVLEMKIQ